MDTYTTIWNRLLLRVPAAGPDLAQDVVRDAFNQLMERRMWTWLIRNDTFYAPVYTSPGTVTTLGGAILGGNGTSFIPDLIGKQIRIGSIGGSSYPTYTIIQVPSPTMVVLDRPWVGPLLINMQYMLFQCYFATPTDFQYFYSVTNPTANYRLNHDATQAELDSYDPQRSQSGIAYALAYYDTTQNYAGSVGGTLQITGTGSIPISTTQSGFNYPEDSIYSIVIQTPGPSGTATFNWKQEAGLTQGSNLVSSVNPIDLSNGVQVYFPAGNYNSGDVFVIPCTADTSTGVPVYELWPRPIAAPYVYPFSYACKIPALSDEHPDLPNFVARRGDILLEMSLTNLAMWPGTADQPNPYHDLSTANTHRVTSEKMIYELEKKDDDTAIKDLTYQRLPFSGPWFDGSWLQRHAMYPDY